MCLKVHWNHETPNQSLNCWTLGKRRRLWVNLLCLHHPTLEKNIPESYWIMACLFQRKEQVTQTGYSRITAWIIWTASSTSSATTHMSALLNFRSLVVLGCCSLASWYSYVPLLGGAFEIEAFHVNSSNSPCWPKSAWQLLCSRSNIFKVFWWNHLHQPTRKNNGVFYRDLMHPKWRKQIWKRYVDSSIETTNPNNRWSYVKLTLALHFFELFMTLHYSHLFPCFEIM